MNYSDYRFTLDVQIHQAQVSVPVTLNDTARRLYIGFTDGRKPYTIPNGCRAVFAAHKPDGNTILNDCIIENNKTVVYEFSRNTTNAEGTVDCEIRLYDATGKELTSPQFIIVVDKKVIRDEEVPLSESESTTLDRIISSEFERIEAEEKRKDLIKFFEPIVPLIRQNGYTGEDGVNFDIELGKEYKAVDNQGEMNVSNAKLYVSYLDPESGDICEKDVFSELKNLDEYSSTFIFKILGFRIAEEGRAIIFEYCGVQYSCEFYLSQTPEIKGIRLEWDGELYLCNPDGVKDGKSAYDIAVEEGFIGTKKEWLDSLKYAKDGVTFIPHVSEEGVLYWTNDKGLDNPAPVDIWGKQGHISTLKTINGGIIRFFVGTHDAYKDLSVEDKQNLFAIFTDDTAKEDIEKAILKAQQDLAGLAEKLLNGGVTVKNAENAEKAGHADYSVSAGFAEHSKNAQSAHNSNRLTNNWLGNANEGAFQLSNKVLENGLNDVLESGLYHGVSASYTDDRLKANTPANALSSYFVLEVLNYGEYAEDHGWVIQRFTGIRVPTYESGKGIPTTYVRTRYVDYNDTNEKLWTEWTPIIDGYNIGEQKVKSFKSAEYTGKDLNSLTEEGWYWGTATKSTSNLPINGEYYCLMEVVRYSNHWILQRFNAISADGKPRIYTRSYYLGKTWSPWIRIIDENNISDQSVKNADRASYANGATYACHLITDYMKEINPYDVGEHEGLNIVYDGFYLIIAKKSSGAYVSGIMYIKDGSDAIAKVGEFDLGYNSGTRVIYSNDDCEIYKVYLMSEPSAIG